MNNNIKLKIFMLFGLPRGAADRKNVYMIGNHRLFVRHAIIVNTTKPINGNSMFRITLFHATYVRILRGIQKERLN